jgi:guanine deaminase
MTGNNAGFSVCGTLMHTPSLGEVQIIETALVSVDARGRISGVHPPADPAYRKAKGAAKKSGSLIELQEGQYLLPGMIDLHIHAPQWPQLGKALHLPLYEWLQQCTFPLEARYADLDFAERSYRSLVENLLANGTTTAMYFGTVHLEATKLLAEICADQGQRGLVGKVAMDNPDECPEYYRDPTTREGLDDTCALIEYIRGMDGNDSGLVQSAVTPRFIPSCTDEMLQGLGRIADEYGCHVQTHCSESDWEHNYVLERHGIRDTQSLDNFALLTGKTVLAHSNLISDDDMQTIRRNNSGIAHCPMSNFYFANAVFPARRALDLELDVGLGTDISGGAHPSMLHNCHIAVTSSRALEDGVDPRRSAESRGAPGERIDFKEAFWMATTGGARALDLEIGQFKKDYAFDAIVVDANVPDTNLIVWDEIDSLEDVLQKIIYNAERRNITKVWVQGRLVK